MKNIHVLPTEKPSRLLKFANHFIFDKETEVAYKRNQHIYITSDEKIKEGDCVYSTSQDYNIQKVSKGLVKSYQEVEHYKKIILTTDQDLIADGVQAIDDEFLEWFVKNPGCEEVEVRKYHSGILSDISEITSSLKIIIPQKNIPMTECYFIPSKIPSSPTICDDCGKEKSLHTIGEDIKASKSVIIRKEEPKHESLEEYAFRNGAEWQAKRMYSEEEVRELLLIQRGNSYVAILTKTKDKELAAIASTAPEPGGKDGWVKQFKNK
jgi:hypothetical protein